MKVLVLDYSISKIALECAREYRLLPRDALHTACCKAFGINKYDLNPEAARKIEELCQQRGIIVAGRLPYHTAVVEAMVSALAVVGSGRDRQPCGRRDQRDVGGSGRAALS